MSSPESQSSKEVLIKEVFKPGNLVWGGNYIDEEAFHSLSTKGILPAISHKSAVYPIRPYSICFAMLSNLSSKTYTLGSYETAIHYGPKSYSTDSQYPFEIRLSIISSPEKLLPAYYDKIKAVGDYLHTDKHYPIDKESNTVAGIPLGFVQPYAEEPWSDEVNIDFTGAVLSEIQGVTPEFWEGLVTLEKSAFRLKEWMEQEKLNLPLFSPTGELL